MIEKDLLMAKEMEKKLSEKIFSVLEKINEKESPEIAGHVIMSLCGKLISALATGLSESDDKKDILIEFDKIMPALKILVDKNIDGIIEGIEDEEQRVEMII